MKVIYTVLIYAPDIKEYLVAGYHHNYKHASMQFDSLVEHGYQPDDLRIEKGDTSCLPLADSQCL